MKRIKVCMLVTNFTTEGNVVFDLGKELVKSGDEVCFVVPHEGKLPTEEIIEGVRIKRFRYAPSFLEQLGYGSGLIKNIKSTPLKLLLLPSFFVGFCFETLKTAKDYDVIHAHWLPTVFVAFFAKVVLKKPVVLTVHGTDVRAVPNFVVRLGLRLCDEVTSCHDVLAKRLNAKIVRNMIAFDKIENPDTKEVESFGFWNKPVALWVGRFIEERDPETFVLASRNLPDVNFLMVGDGKLLEKTKSLVKESNNVFFTGRRNDVSAFFNLCSVFVSTATFDNIFSSTTVEACLAGKPLVLTDVGKTRDYFSSDSACLVLPKDATGLSSAISRAMKIDSLGRKGKEVIVRAGFDKEEILRKNREIYEQVLK